MRSWIIAWLEIKRMQRNQFFWLMALLSLSLLFFMDAFNYFTIEEQLKMIQDFSLGIMNLITLFFVIYYPISQIKDEFKEKTIYAMLSTPVTRNQFIFGKALAMAGIIGIALILNLISLSIMLFLKGGSVYSALIIGVLMIYLKNLTLLGFAYLFAVLPVSGMISSVLVLFVYIIGSVKTYFLVTLNRGIPEWLVAFQKIVLSVIPNFRIYDVVENITLGKAVAMEYLTYATLHCLGISVVAYFSAFYLFNRKQL